MSSRAKVWLIGLVVTAALAGSLGWDVSSRELSIPVALLVLGLFALIAEGSALRAPARGQGRQVAPEGARAADGVIDVIPVSGVEGEINPVAPRFRRFVRMVASSPGPGSSMGLRAANPPMLGRIALISVFVGRDGGDWTAREIANCLEGLERVGLWVEREASRRVSAVNIGLADAYFQVADDTIDRVEVAFSPEGDDVGPMEADASTKAIIGASRVAALLGFKDVADLLATTNPLIEADARAWLFHLRRAGRSLAIPASDCDVDGVGLAVCFSKEASFPEPLLGTGRLDPTTAAHEILHLFGATDKYGVSLRSFPRGCVTPQDIMRLNHDSLFRMTIDNLTASEIGWEASLEPRTKSTKNARR